MSKSTGVGLLTGGDRHHRAPVRPPVGGRL